MKIKLLRTHPFEIGLFPEGTYPVHRPVNAAGAVGKPDSRFVDVPKGTILDAAMSPRLRDLWKLCRFGVAVPADTECAQKVDLTNDQMAVLAQKYDLLDKAQATGNPEIDAKGGKAE